MVANPKIIVYSETTGHIDILSQMTDLFYEICPVSFSSDLTELRGLKRIVASIIIKPRSQVSVLKKLKEVRAAFPELPVLIIADSPSKEEIIHAFRMGVSDFLISPVETEELISCLQRNTWLQRNNLNISASPTAKKWDSIKIGFKNLRRKFRLDPPLKFSTIQARTTLNTSILPLPIITGSASSEKEISVQMLGKFKIKLNKKKELKLKGRNSKYLLAYLFYHRKKRIHREKLMNIFWPNSLSDCARNCLNVTIHNIRKTFQKHTSEKDIIVYKDECYSFKLLQNVELDVEKFIHFWKKGLAFENTGDVEKSIDYFHKAIAVYKGDFIEDLLYEEWCEMEREHLKERYLVILDRLSSYYFKQGNYQKTVELCNIMLKKDNCLEEIHRRLIASFKALGSRDKAIRQFKKCTQTLQKELEIEPSQITRELYEKIKA